MRVILLRIFYVIEAGLAIFAIVKLFSFSDRVRKVIQNLIKNRHKIKEDEINEIEKMWRNERIAINLSVILLIFFVITLLYLFINQK